MNAKQNQSSSSFKKLTTFMTPNRNNPRKTLKAEENDLDPLDAQSPLFDGSIMSSNPNPDIPNLTEQAGALDQLPPSPRLDDLINAADREMPVVRANKHAELLDNAKLELERQQQKDITQLRREELNIQREKNESDAKKQNNVLSIIQNPQQTESILDFLKICHHFFMDAQREARDIHAANLDLLRNETQVKQLIANTPKPVIQYLQDFKSYNRYKKPRKYLPLSKSPYTVPLRSKNSSNTITKNSTHGCIDHNVTKENT